MIWLYQKAAKRFVRITYPLVQAVAVLVAAAAVSVRFDSPRMILALAVTKRSPQCSLGQAWSDWRRIQGQLASTRKALSNARILRTDPDGCALWDLPQGRLWVPARLSNPPVVVLAETELGIYGRRLCKPGDVVIDGGAHVGIYTRAVLKAGASMVIAVEPSPENYVCLRKNLESEIAAGRVVVIEKGVWNREARLPFSVQSEDSGADHVTSEARPGETLVSVTTIDAIVAELGLSSVDVIKMDVEGSERQALDGAIHTLVRFRPRLRLAAYHLRGDPEAFRDRILKAWPGYKMKCAFCIPERGLFVPEVVYFD